MELLVNINFLVTSSARFQIRIQTGTYQTEPNGIEWSTAKAIGEGRRRKEGGGGGGGGLGKGEKRRAEAVSRLLLSSFSSPSFCSQRASFLLFPFFLFFFFFLPFFFAPLLQSETRCTRCSVLVVLLSTDQFLEP